MPSFTGLQAVEVFLVMLINMLQRSDPRKCAYQAVLLRRGHCTLNILQRGARAQTHNAAGGHNTSGNREV